MVSPLPNQHIAQLSLLVHEYDEAIRFFTQVLGFTLTEDRALAPEKRWVVVTPNGGGCGLLLARAADDAQRLVVGNQTGGRVFMFLHTQDFEASYRQLQAGGVRFAESPRDEAYGRVVVFFDLYGNKWDLVERRMAHP